VPLVTVELQEKATRRLVRREIRQARSADRAAQWLAADEQPPQAILRRAAPTRVRLAPVEWQSVRPGRVFFAPTRQV
jgi:hypothetical protein